MKTSEFKNDYLYFVVKADNVDGREVLTYCSGINVTRFLPMMRGRLGLGSNPLVSGLQLVKYDICTLAHSRGAVPNDHHSRKACAGTAPTSEGWFTETLLIENPGSLSPEEIVSFAVKGMIRRINATSLSVSKVPYDLPPAEIQRHLEPLCAAA
jgi:hypothetical protein